MDVVAERLERGILEEGRLLVVFTESAAVFVRVALSRFSMEVLPSAQHADFIDTG